MANESSGNVLLNLYAGHRVTAIIHTPAKLEVADLLKDWHRLRRKRMNLQSGRRRL